MKGSGRGGQHQQQRPALGEEGDFAVHASVYGKVQAEPTINPNDQGRRKEEERCFFLPLPSYLATYIGCVLCASLSRLGGGTHSTAIVDLPVAESGDSRARGAVSDNVTERSGEHEGSGEDEGVTRPCWARLVEVTG